MGCDLIQLAVGGSTSGSWRLLEYYRVGKNETLSKSEESGPECYFSVWTNAYLMQIVLLEICRVFSN